MLSKAQIIMTTPKMSGLLNVQPLPHDDYTVLAAEQYLGVGCDLRDLVGLDAVLSKSVHQIDDCLVLCVAEVSVTYMDPTAADALIAWAGRLTSGMFRLRAPVDESDKHRCHFLLTGAVHS